MVKLALGIGSQQCFEKNKFANFGLCWFLGPKIYFPEFIARFSLKPTSPNLYVHYVGSNIFSRLRQSHVSAPQTPLWLTDPV